MGVVDPVEMSDTEQGDIGLETQQDSDTSDEDTQDTQAATGTQSGKGKGKGKADKRSKKPPVLFTAEQEQTIVDFLRDNEILYNKRLMDYKDRSKREAVWDKFCEENNLNKDACQKWFQSQRKLFRKVTHMKSGQGEPVLTERQKWTRDNFDFLRDHIVHLLLKPVQQRAHHPDRRLCTLNRSRILLIQSQLVTLQTSRNWRHICLLPARVLSV